MYLFQKAATQEIQSGTRPDHVTFAAVLAACAHFWMVNGAWKIFNEMFLK